MAKTLQHRRGSTATLSTETGSVGEIFIDTTKKTVVVMDGTTAGGFALEKEGAGTGATGAQGLTGATGAAGSNGTNGATGAAGANGATGSQGIQGASGVQGASGSTGLTGATGAAGSNGTNGTNGATGPTGATGVTGTNGASGVQGASGSTGLTGATGVGGATGSFSGTPGTDYVAPGTATNFTAQQYFGNVALTDASTISWAANTAQTATFTFVSNNRTMGAPTGLANGAFYSLAVIQNSGSNTLTWNSVFKWASGAAPTLSTGAAAKDYFVFRSDGTNLYEQGRSLNVS